LTSIFYFYIKIYLMSKRR